MKKAATGATAGTGWETKATRCAAVLLGCAACAAAAQEPSGRSLDAAAEAARPEASVRMELKASSLPRLEAEDGGFQSPRLDLSLLPPGRSTMGLVAGLSQPTARGLLNPSGGTGRAAVDVGVHWRHTLADNRQIDITAWRRMAPLPDAHTLAQQQEPVYGARLEMNLNPPRKRGLTASKGFLGMQLQSGARISVKRKNGGPMVYYRTTF